MVLPFFALGLVQKICATLSTNQMQTKTSHDWVARAFPRFEFSVALDVIFYFFDWPLCNRKKP